MHLIQELCKKQLIPGLPSFLAESIQYLTVMGSEAYGVATEHSDFDCYGWCIPDKKMIFPHLDGVIPGFGNQGNKFNVWQHHHIFDPSAQGGKGREYDFAVYGIVSFFQLVMENNPNMVDSLFVPLRCILFETPVGEMVRSKRHIFLSKRVFHTCKGYAYQQLHKMRIKNPDGKRKEMVDRFGYDVKFGYNVVRLINEAKQMLIEGDLDLEASKEQLKSIRRGEWKVTDIEDYFKAAEKELEELYRTSKLPHSPREVEIKELLLTCLEQHFGSLDKCIVREDKDRRALEQIQSILAGVL